MDRVTAVDALMHPYLAPFGNPADEQVCAEPFHIEDELDDFNICHYQVRIYLSFLFLSWIDSTTSPLRGL